MNSPELEAVLAVALAVIAATVAGTVTGAVNWAAAAQVAETIEVAHHRLAVKTKTKTSTNTAGVERVGGTYDVGTPGFDELLNPVDTYMNYDPRLDNIARFRSYTPVLKLWIDNNSSIEKSTDLIDGLIYQQSEYMLELCKEVTAITSEQEQFILNLCNNNLKIVYGID